MWNILKKGVIGVEKRVLILIFGIKKDFIGVSLMM